MTTDIILGAVLSTLAGLSTLAIIAWGYVIANRPAPLPKPNRPEAVDRLIEAVYVGDNCRCEHPVVVGSDSSDPYCDDCGGDLKPHGLPPVVPDLTPEQVRAAVLAQLRDLRGGQQ